MARASIRTILSLDKYAKIMGINPVFFSGANQINLPSGNVLFPLDNAQNDIWPQYSWQNFDQVSREELALQLKIAEDNIVDYLGYYPIPQWTVKERYNLPDFYRPELQANNLEYNVYGDDIELRLNHTHFIETGRRSTTFLGNVNVAYTDENLDGFDETATISFATTTSLPEVKIYFAGRNADPTYEIRDPRTKTATGGVVTLTFYTWQLIDPEVHEEFPTGDGDPAIDLLDADNLVDTVDVYREFNDVSKEGAVFYDVDRYTGIAYPTSGFLYSRDIGDYATPLPGTYNATTGCWERAYNQCFVSDYVELWYYSGMRINYSDTKDADSYLQNDIALAIAYMATARLERVFYVNNNATALAASLREDHTESVQGQSKFVPPESVSNPFGAKVGEFRAWRLISRYKTSKRNMGGSVI